MGRVRRHARSATMAGMVFLNRVELVQVPLALATLASLHTQHTCYCRVCPSDVSKGELTERTKGGGSVYSVRAPKRDDSWPIDAATRLEPRRLGTRGLAARH